MIMQSCINYVGWSGLALQSQYLQLSSVNTEQVIGRFMPYIKDTELKWVVLQIPLKHSNLAQAAN